MNILMKFLPKDKRALLELAIRITASVDTKQKRTDVANFGIEMLADGKVSVGEWSQFGSMLGILTGKKH